MALIIIIYYQASGLGVTLNITQLPLAVTPCALSACLTVVITVVMIVCILQPWICCELSLLVVGLACECCIRDK